MFENISGKLKVLANVLTLIGIVISVIYGFIIMNDSPLAGLLAMAIGGLISWASSFLIYGFGELIEQMERSNNNTYVISKQLEQMLKENKKKDE